MVQTKTDPDLAMTEVEVEVEVEVDAILGNAQAEAEQAVHTLEQAEETVRSEAPSEGLAMRAAEVTPARLVEMRAAVDLAQMKVQAAEKRTEEVREKRKLAEWETIRAQICQEAAADLDGAENIVDALDVFEAGLKGLCEAMKEHNDRFPGGLA